MLALTVVEMNRDLAVLSAWGVRVESVLDQFVKEAASVLFDRGGDKLFDHAIDANLIAANRVDDS
jgi:hypothetical protein